MFNLRKSFLLINLAGLLSLSGTGYAATSQNLHEDNFKGSVGSISSLNDNKSFFYISALYVQPKSDNLKYASFVSGVQPYYQSWHLQAINPDYHPAFELGLNYALPNTSYSGAVYWTHLYSNDNASKQATTNTDLTTVEFVAPPFEMSPPVFGIKRAYSKVNFEFDNVLLNVSRLVEFGPNVQAHIFGGISVLNLNQTIDTTFSDYAGSPATPYSYPLPPDPAFSFELQNVSRYLGAGPDIGFSFQYETPYHFGILGQFLGLLTAGTITTQDNFTSTSTRLNNLGIGTSHQKITAPNATQIVLGADGKLGVFYRFQKNNYADVTISLGYRMATYLNAISTVTPSTLVQPGTVVITPEFSTGTMAIVSTNASTHPFNFNGPFLDLKIAMD